MNLVVITPHGRRDGVLGHLPHALVDVVHDRLAIDRISNGPSHMEIFPERLGMVEREIADIHSRLRDELEIGILLGQWNICWIGKLADVDVACLQLQKTNRVFWNGSEDQFIEVGAA